MQPFSGVLEGGRFLDAHSWVSIKKRDQKGVRLLLFLFFNHMTGDHCALGNV